MGEPIDPISPFLAVGAMISAGMGDIKAREEAESKQRMEALSRDLQNCDWSYRGSELVGTPRAGQSYTALNSLPTAEELYRKQNGL